MSGTRAIHASWDTPNYVMSSKTKVRSVISELSEAVQNAISRQSRYNEIKFQRGIIPVIAAKQITRENRVLQKQMYDLFFKEVGCVILKDVFDKSVMNALNQWTERMLDEAKLDANSVHPKQKDKYLVNDVILRMASTNPNLLLKTVFDPTIMCAMDSLLGFARIGSATMHWIQPGGDRQEAHVDYPIHVGSGAFWEGRVNKIMETMTSHQIEHIMPYYSIQTLIACDSMDSSNGSTEVIPCSHKIKNMDLVVHEKSVKEALESKFVNVSLQEGDVLIFNRRLCHRGGANKSKVRRNALIIQSVFLWGIGQEIIQSSRVLQKLALQSSVYKSWTTRQKRVFLSRIQAPYPINVKDRT